MNLKTSPRKTLPWLALLSLVLPVSVAIAAPPTLEELDKVQLHEGFTLTYTVIEKDVRSPETKAAELKNELDNNEDMVKQGLIKQAEADRIMAQFQAIAHLPSPPREFTVTISARAGRLLVIRQQRGAHSYGLDVHDRPQVSPYRRNVFLYDGHKTYLYESIGSTLSIQSGLRTQGLTDCLLPGVGLPYLPLVRPMSSDAVQKSGITLAQMQQQPGDAGRRCAVLMLHLVDVEGKGNVYFPGQAFGERTGTGTRLTRLVVGSPARPMETWEFQEPRRFQGLWLARRAGWTSNRTFRDGKSAPTQAADYQVTQAETTPLAAAKFEIRTHLSAKTEIEEREGGQVFRYAYDPLGGTLATQRPIALQHQEVVARRQAEQSKQIAAQMKVDQTNHGDGRSADLLLERAKTQARAEGKNVFLIFHASWCGPCFRLHRFLNGPTVRPIIEAHYVVQEIDVFESNEQKRWENPGGQALYTKYGGQNAVPFFAILNTSGAKQGDSTVRERNQRRDMGMPSTKADINTFVRLLQKTAPGLSAADVRVLQAALLQDSVSGE